jgi:hypothetical protein
MIELKEKQIIGNEIHVIAEYNIYDGDRLIQQLSRSPFVYSDTMTDEEIIADVRTNYYYIYG